MPDWTREQLEVINSDADTLICSAAAGSGKTAVLVERIVTMIAKGADPYGFLIVTFTTAAASEMKEKIRYRLRSERNNPIFRRALECVDGMNISTIHSYCQSLIRREFQAVGIDPMFSICDSARRKKWFSEAFRDACNELYSSDDDDFKSFRHSYDRKQAEDTVDSVYHFIMSMPDPYDWLNKAADKIPGEVDKSHPWFRCIRLMIEDKIRSANVILKRQEKMFDEDCCNEQLRAVLKSDMELFHVKQLWLNDENRESRIPEGSFVRMPAAKKGLNDHELDWKERYGKERDKLKKIDQEINTLAGKDAEKYKKELAAIRRDCKGLIKITEATGKRFTEIKKQRKSLDFNDLEHYALKILRTEPFRTSVREQTEHIFVDECQDVSAVQDAIIQELHGENNDLFMVGDVKQSIYRFRLADPTIFLRRIREISTGEIKNSQCIFLQTNFRSRPEILETANEVFRDVMREETAEMDYSSRDELIPGRKTEGTVKVSVDLIEKEDKKEYTVLEATADRIAKRIKDILKEGKYSLRDIVILMPAVNPDGAKLGEFLKKRDIPVFFDGGGDYYSLPEVAGFRQLLEIIDSPDKDLPLISALKNAPFFFSEEELSGVRLTETGESYCRAFEKCAEMDTELGRRCAEAKKRIAEWRFRAEMSRPGDFCWYLLEDTGRYALAGLEKNGENAQANLRMICQQARTMEDSGILTLREFLSYMNEQAASGDAVSAALLGENDELVRIMTMHKSKGLQFPVVFLAGMDHSVTGKRNTNIMTDDELGICLRYKEPRWRVSRKTVFNDIFTWKKEKDEKAEKIRLLYVAMTRAQEKMFLVSCRTSDPLWGIQKSTGRITEAKTYIDWVIPALRDADIRIKSTGCAQAENPWKIRVFEEFQQETVEKEEVVNNLEEWVRDAISGPAVEDLWIKDKNIKTQKLAKRSVTELISAAQRLIGETGEEETIEDKRLPESYDRLMKKYRLPDVPDFMRQDRSYRTGAWHGTVVHRFLSLVDLDALRSSEMKFEEVIEREKERMKNKGIFTGEEAGEIKAGEISAFFSSQTGKRLLAADEVRREWNFNLLVEERDMLVQGVIDCAFREGEEWILMDYKTDRVSSLRDLLDKYRPQLEWYATAIKKLTGKPVREWWLYSISLRKGIRGFSRDSGFPQAENL